MASKNIKVMIAIPSQDTVKARTAFCLVHATKDLKFDVDMLLRMGCDIIGSRTWLARETLKRGATHILFVDHDMYFAPDTIEKLVAHDKDIVGATYNFRSLPERSTVYPLEEPAPKDKLFKCKAVGTGMMLIKTDVFTKVPEPWFRFGRDIEGEMILGEDAYFCQEAMKAGFDVWADPTLSVKHIGEYLY